jgi:hypothetical protein
MSPRSERGGLRGFCPDAAAPDGPLVIAGMSYFGLSRVATIVANAGVHLGADAARRGRPRHHDRELADFHLSTLAANGIVPEGYTTQAEVVVPDPLRCEAARLIAARRGRGHAWGWADPTATLLLDFWRTEVADARFLLVFCRPWEVVDELYRHGGGVFRHHPSLALDVWLHYNRRVVEFAIGHPRITIVCEAESAVADPRRLCQTVRRQFAVPLCDPSGEAGGPRPGGDDRSGRAMLLQALCPQAIDLYRRLQDLAGTPTTLPASGTEAASASELWRHLLADWQRSAVADRPSSSPFQWWPALRRKAA